ncbi:hypothetical protein [Lentibacillus salicampi]|uniref:Uncharacterized protein n=1 Tax=Lentibacillus salicampi TaxID=175306 RepID=A0A4Y9A9R9_9BACI|nr:hypothetical protein [Lentibacillus salicampi]TFJ91907.1 hypothetical protein E4U82_15105 [Lentibacillus salicampi]
MVSAWVVTKVAYVVISIAAGLIFFYVTSPLVKSEKKQPLEESVSLLINFVLYIWVGKILLNIDVFITDPLAILAYPSDSDAFYAATLLLFGNVIYKVKWKGLNIGTIMSSLAPVFLGSAFVYEFIEVVMNDSTLAWGHLGLLFLLLLFFLIFHERQSSVATAGGIFTAWSLGQLILTFYLPYTTLYGYMMTRWFLVLVFILSMTNLIQNKRLRS